MSTNPILPSSYEPIETALFRKNWNGLFAKLPRERQQVYTSFALGKDTSEVVIGCETRDIVYRRIIRHLKRVVNSASFAN